MLGAHERTHQGVDGVSFAVWAPAARGVAVAGDFNDWDPGRTRLRPLGSSGVWEGFVPGAVAGQRYKFEVVGADGIARLKADPMARATELPPATASVVEANRHVWGDEAWLTARATTDQIDRHLAVYELHLASWRRVVDESTGPDGRPLTYAEAGRGARRPRHLAGLHPRRAHARGRAPLRRVVGLPGHQLLRAHRPLRHPRRLPGVRRRAPPARRRRDRRLGAGALPQGRVGAGPLRRHRAVRARRPTPGRAPRLGHPGVQLRPHTRSATS